jgi:hypothetical protein
MELLATPNIVDFLGQNGEVDDKGRKALPKFAWPGGYPVFYVTSTFEIVCDKHATETIYGEGYDGESIVDADVNWEDSNLYCDSGPSHRIESAYAEDDIEGELQ